MKKFLFTSTLFLMFSASVAFAADTADILFVVDESGSMAGEHAWIGSMVTSLETGLIAGEVGNTGSGQAANRYAMVGYGNANIPPAPPGQDPYKILVGGGDWGDDAQLATAAGTLTTYGGLEDGYEAINYALNNYTFRSDAALNIVLITDEDRDVTSADTYASTLAALGSKNALLNVVVDNAFGSDSGGALGRFADTKDLNPLVDGDGNPVPGGTADVENAVLADGAGGYTLETGATTGTGFGTTTADYVNLALQNGGGAWNLNILRSGGLNADSFTAAFVDLKVQEIEGQPPTSVPDASVMLLLATSFGIFGALRRR